MQLVKNENFQPLCWRGKAWHSEKKFIDQKQDQDMRPKQTDLKTKDRNIKLTWTKGDRS